MKNIVVKISLLILLVLPRIADACSVLYYVDAKTGTVYVVNNEDYFLDTKASIQIEPRTENSFARLWYGWDDFAQGGINEKGLFFDGATTPKQKKIKGSRRSKGNLGDRILAQCSTVEEALSFLEKEKVALRDAHMMFGDKTGIAVIVEWVDGKRKTHYIKDNKLIMTNYLLSKPAAGNYPCYRYESIEKRIEEMENSGDEITLLKVGNTFGQAGQMPKKINKKRSGGTIYTSFINISEGKFFLSYKLSNQNVIKLDLKHEFESSKRKKIDLRE